MTRVNQLVETRVTNLFILRTNLQTRSEFARLEQHLLNVPGVHWCTIDLEDCDKVLRVECENLSLDAIVTEAVRLGFSCEELED